MKIAILGTGGVGGYFGGKLALAGNEVSFLARGQHLEALKSNGISVKSILGDFSAKNIKAVEKINEIETPDLVLVCVKAWQVKEIAIQMKDIISKDTVILPLQNGVLASEEIRCEIDKGFVASGLCRIISKIEAPGIIKHFGIDPEIVFGAFPDLPIDNLQKIKIVFDQAEIRSRISEDIEADLWRKFISICISGLMAITRCSYGEIRELKETRAMMYELFNEIYQLAVKKGIKLEADYVEKAVSFIDKIQYESTTSLARDVWEGKPSEIEYQNGTVVKLSEKYNVQVPLNRFIYHSILPMELKARKR